MSSEELALDGWCISTEGYSFLTQNGNVKAKKVLVQYALDTDIKVFGDAVLSKELRLNKTGKIVLQIQKIRNISAPKSKENSQAAPRMLKLTLTDGHTSCQAVEVSSIPSISYTHTPPGAKLLINRSNIISNCLLLHPDCCTLLGGQVAVLYEKWVVAKDISDHVRTLVGGDGPPPWVNFGGKIISSIPNEPFKSLVDKVSKETIDEFDVHRRDAISVASTGAVKKVFGGGTKAAQDNQILSFKKYENRTDSRGFRKRDAKEKVVEKSMKPAEKVSLFDFLEDKLVINNDDAKSTSQNDNNAVSKPDYSQQQQRKNYSNRFQPKYAKSGQNNYNNTNYSTSFSNDDKKFTTNSVESVTKTFGEMSVNSQFANRNFQHFNLANDKSASTKSKDTWIWQIGDLCMAKYWEDGKYYNATITHLTERTCVVRFNEYGNVEEVLKVDCIPISDFGQESTTTRAKNNLKNSMGYRSNKRMYTNTHNPFHKAT